MQSVLPWFLWILSILSSAWQLCKTQQIYSRSQTKSFLQTRNNRNKKYKELQTHQRLKFLKIWRKSWMEANKDFNKSFYAVTFLLRFRNSIIRTIFSIARNCYSSSEKQPIIYFMRIKRHAWRNPLPITTENIKKEKRGINFNFNCSHSGRQH